MKGKRDTLFAAQAVDRFTFDQRVADVFEDMIRRSVPGYALTLDMLGVMAKAHARRGQRIYDLGCSLGAGLMAMRPHVPADCELIGADRSLPMLQRARTLVPDRRIRWVCCDIRDLAIENACLVAMNFTLQFLPVADRLPLLERIRRGLRPGGVLVLSEKLRFDDAESERFHTEMHHAFKRLQGYSQLEISRKRNALEKVLLPETLHSHRQRLMQAGFRQVYVWFQCFNFASLVAMR